MNENQHEFPDELISAYLDGELSPAEKVRVEEQLMDSAEHRRLFEELKALRRSLQSLPAETLGDDFAARVLRRAERELLADGGADKSKGTETTPEKLVAAEVVTAAPHEVQIDRGTRRGLVWSILATAAAVGLLTFGPLWNRSSPNVSLLPGTAPTSETAPDKAKQPEQISGPTEKGDAKNGVDLRALPMAAAPEEPTPHVGFGEVKQGVNRTGEANALQPARESLATEGEGLKLQNNDAINGASRYNASSTFEGSRGAATGGEAPGARAKDRAEQERRQLSQEKETAERTAANKFADDGTPLGKSGVDDQSVKAFGGAGRSSLPLMAARSRDELQVAKSPSAMGVVMLDVKRESLTAKFFDQLLARHDIQVELARADRKAEQLDRTDDAEAIANAAPTDAPGEERDGAAVEEAAAGVGQGGSAENLADLDAVDEQAKYDVANEDHADVDLMYVEATPEQIDALLRDLESQHGDVLAMAYDGVGPAKKGNQAEAWAADGTQRFRALANLKDLELHEEAKLAAKFAEQNATSPAAGEKPQATAAVESQRDDRVALSEPAAPQSDAQVSDARLSGVARRLSLKTLAQAERQQLRRGGAAGAAALPAPAPVLAESSGDERPAEVAADAVLETESAPTDALTISPQAEGGAPAAPPVNQPLPVNMQDKLAKAKEQQSRVRVLFVLRAVTPPAVSEPTPAEAAPAESPQ